MDLTYVGFLAAICTSTSFLFQVLRILKTKDTSSISLIMYIVFVFGTCMWLIYGISIGAKPMMFANSLTLLLSSTILGLKIYHTVKNKE